MSDARAEASAEAEAAQDGQEEGTAAFKMTGVARHTVVYGLGILLTKGISFILLPLYTRYLTPADYGVMALVEMTLDVISIVGGANLALGVFRFYHKATTEEDRNTVIATAFMLLSASYLIAGGAAWLAAGKLSELVFATPEYTGIIRLAAANLMLQSTLAVPFSVIRVRDRSTFFVLASAGRLTLQLSLNIYMLVYLGMGVRGIFISNLIATAVLGSGLTIWMIRSTGLRPSNQYFGELLRYGLPLVVMQLALFAGTFGDRYFLQANATTADVGIYSLAYQFGFLLGMIGTWPFEQVWGPKRFEIAKRDDRDEILADGFVYANLLLVTVAVGISVLVKDVLTVMTTPQFHEAWILVNPILVAYAFQGWCGIHDIGILVREKTTYLSVANWIAAAIAIAGYALLIPAYGGMGAAFATLISFAIRWILTYTMAQRLWYVRYDWAPVLRLVLVAGLVCIAAFFLPIDNVWMSLGVRVVLIGVYFVLVWVVALDRDRRRRIEETARQGISLARAAWSARAAARA